MLIVRTLALSIAFSSCIGYAATIVVDDSAGCSLRQAVLSANSDTSVGSCDAGSGADVIQLDSNNYEVTTSAISISSNITIQGVSGSIIDKDGSTGIAHRLFTVMGSNASLTLNDLELYGDFTFSTADNGGCIWVGPEASLTLYNSVISLCLSDLDGGAIYIAETASASIQSSQVQLNTALQNGGGVFSAGALSISDASSISSNKADDGAGLYVSGANASLSVTRSDIFANTATSEGGGITASLVTSIAVTNTTITQNRGGASTSSIGDGGGISLVNATMTITNSTISENIAQADGGGFHLLSSDLTIANSIVTGNSASSGSGHEFYLVSPSTFITASSITATAENLFGESSNDIASAFVGYTPSSDIIIANSDGNNPAPFSDIIETATDHDTADGSGVNGTTYANALTTDSLAYTAADEASCPSVDQRGVVRKTDFFVPIQANNGNMAVIHLGNVCDLGAYEEK